MRFIGVISEVLMFGLAVIGTASAKEGQPTQQVLKIMPDGTWMLTNQMTKPVFEQQQYQVTVMVPQVVTKQVKVGDVIKTENSSVNVPETKTVTRNVCKHIVEAHCCPVDTSTVKAFETDGRPIPVAEVVKRCPTETLVVVSANRDMIPDYYTAVLKPGTILLALSPATPVLPAPARQVPNSPAANPPAVPATPTPPAPTSVNAPAAPSVSGAPVATFAPTAGFSPPLPMNPAPELVFLSREGVDAVKIRQFEEVVSESDVTVLTNDSSISPETFLKTRQIRRRSVSSIVPWSALRIGVGSDGFVPVDRLKELLGQGEVTAVLSVDGRLIDPFWLQNFKSNVLIIRGVKLLPEMPVLAPPMTTPPSSPVFHPAPFTQPAPMPTPPLAPTKP